MARHSLQQIQSCFHHSGLVVTEELVLLWDGSGTAESLSSRQQRAEGSRPLSILTAAVQRCSFSQRVFAEWKICINLGWPLLFFKWCNKLESDKGPKGTFEIPVVFLGTARHAPTCWLSCGREAAGYGEARTRGGWSSLETNQKSPQRISGYIVSSPDLKVDGPVVKAFCWGLSAVSF